MNSEIYKLMSQLQNINASTYKCCCHRIFPNQPALQQHFTEAHLHTDSAAKESLSNNSCHKCSNCNRIFLKEIDMMKHFSATHLFQQPSSPSPSSSRNSSQLHINTLIIAPKSENQAKCKLCNKKFNNSADLLKHTEAVHKDIVCSICKKSFTKVVDFNQHFKAIHSKPNVLPPPASSLKNNPVYPCFMCAKVFATKNDMMKHASATKHMPKTTSNPGKTSASTTSSQPTQTGVICKYCKVKFNRPADLQQHTEAKHKIVCSICTNSFAKHSDYLQHYHASHSKKLPSTLDDFVCSICKQDFLSGDDLIAHVRQNHSSSLLTKITSSDSSSSTNLISSDKKKVNDRNCDQKNQDTVQGEFLDQPADITLTNNAAMMFKYSVTQNNWKDHQDKFYSVTSESAKLKKIFSISQPTILSVSIKTLNSEIYERCLTIIKMLASNFTVVSTNKHKNYDCKNLVIYCNSFHIFNVQYPASVYIYVTPLPTMPALDETD